MKASPFLELVAGDHSMMMTLLNSDPKEDVQPVANPDLELANNVPGW